MKISSLLGLGLVAVLQLVAGNVAAQSFDLTGFWQDENGTPYTVRHVGSRVSWYMDGGARVKNVFVGTIAGTTITGEWFDLPSGEIRGGGQLALRVESNQRMVKVGESGHYGGSVLTRRGAIATAPPTATVPPTGQVKYLGCFRDQGDPNGTTGRDLDGAVWNDGRMTLEACVAFCQQRGFPYAGTQYASWCFCGNSYGRSGAATNCDMRCGGNQSQVCGGGYANSVFQVR
jgi:hypothetical protein